MKTAALIFGLCLVGFAPAQASDLDRYRFGLSADRIVGMGLDRWERYFNGRVEPSGVTRGVSYAVFVDAIREQNGRLYRQLPVARQTRIRKATALMKQYSDEVGEAAWTFQGGNAYDPKADTDTLAWAESRMLRIAVGRNGSPSTARSLATLRASLGQRQDVFARKLSQASGRAQTFYGAPSESRSRTIAELKAVPKRLRVIASQLNATLQGEPTGVRYEALSAVRQITVFNVRP